MYELSLKVEFEFTKVLVHSISGLPSLRRSALFPNSSELPCCSISYWSEIVIAEDVIDKADDIELEDDVIVGVMSSCLKYVTGLSTGKYVIIRC
jgi:hypothetical protein